MTLPITANVTDADVILPPERFMMRLVGAICRGGVYVGSIYLHTTVGISARCNRDILDAVYGYLCNLSGPWIIGGDWNVTPEELESSGWLRLVKASVVRPAGGATTCHDKCYDYFVVSNSYLHNIIGARAVVDAGWTPHSPCRLFISGRPTVLKVRAIKSPFSLPAVLPYGPLTLADSELEVVIDSGCLDTTGMRVMQAVEQCLYRLAGHER